MPLDTDTLTEAIKAAFEKAKQTPPPENPDDSDQVQDQILTQLAVDLANAIDTFVRSGDVTGITTEVTDLGNNPIGAGTQTGTGEIE